MLKMHLRVNATSLHLRVRCGAGWQARPTLVFLHHFGGSGRSWEAVMEILAAQGWACLAPDLRGFGDSPAPGKDAVSYAVDTMADDIHELLVKLRLPSFVVVGHCLGGKVALALAARRPAGLAGVALLAPSPPTPEPMAKAERARLLDGYGERQAAGETLGRYTAHPLPQERFDAAVADQLRASAPAWRGWLERGSRENIAARLGGVEVPVRIAVGREDQSITGSLVEQEIRARLKRTEASLDVVPRVGHLIPLEAPEATAAFLHGAFVPCELLASPALQPLDHGT